jgi:hypothetical protein
MKTIGAVLLVCLVAMGGMMVGGCALFGPSVEKAQKVYNERQAEVQAAMEAWKLAADRVNSLDARWAKFQADWKAAEDAGDKNALKGLLAQGQLLADEGKKATADLKVAKEVYDSTAALAKAAAGDLKDAKNTSDYVGTVLGYLGLGISTLLGGGAATRMVDNRKIRAKEHENETLAAAARITAANATATFGGTDRWAAFLKAQEDKMAMVPGAREAFRAARS